ncbi:hypothetical protein [Roseomonas gilardii]|uniref:hypothetical protein n=1 Tax=Roseomonas gilardii TaxID=257708 RepID=UPI0011A3F251|nr:hypothetical protein [Roseomonas gilardii]
MTEDAIAKTETLARHLREQDHHAEADRLQAAVQERKGGNAFLEGVREVCQTVLTALEAIDPKTELLAEDLRLEIDRRLGHSPTPPPVEEA